MALFRPFQEKFGQILPQICMATHIFTRPLLCYAAEESASWEHRQLAEQLREQLQGSVPLLPPSPSPPSLPPSPSHLCAVKISQLAICEEVNSADIMLAWGVGGYLCIYCMGFSFLFFPLSMMQECRCLLLLFKICIGSKEILHYLV